MTNGKREVYDFPQYYSVEILIRNEFGKHSTNRLSNLKTMQAQQLEEFIQDVLITIHANIRDLEEKRTFADAEEHDYIDGRLVSYGEILAILRASAHDTGIDPKAIGL